MGIGMPPIEALWVLFISGAAICSVVIIIIVHISFAVAVFRDATYLGHPRKPIFVGRIIWFWEHSLVVCLWRVFTESCTIHV